MSEYEVFTSKMTHDFFFAVLKKTVDAIMRRNTTYKCWIITGGFTNLVFLKKTNLTATVSSWGFSV